MYTMCGYQTGMKVPVRVGTPPETKGPSLITAGTLSSPLVWRFPKHKLSLFPFPPSYTWVGLSQGHSPCLLYPTKSSRSLYVFKEFESFPRAGTLPASLGGFPEQRQCFPTKTRICCIRAPCFSFCFLSYYARLSPAHNGYSELRTDHLEPWWWSRGWWGLSAEPEIAFTL